MELIQLEESERKMILFCKGHLKSKYPWKNNWVSSFKPLFKDIYGWDPNVDNNYQDYLIGLFNKLLDIHLKIQDDQSGDNVQLRGIFSASFSKGIVRTDDLPIERAISELCGLIQCNTVKGDDCERYKLT